jgi:hypothetical protein
MSIVGYNEMNEYLGITVGSSEEEVFVGKQIHESVESWTKIYCRRNFESSSYYEKYDGAGNNYLLLNNFPVTALTRLSIGTIDIISICNTSTSSSASVSVTSSNISLEKDDVPSTLSFSTYQTVATLVAAINNLGDGWRAVSVSSVYDSYKTSMLIEKFGLNCLDSNWVYLSYPDKGEYDFEIDSVKGIVYIPNKFPVGFRNIYVKYTAGYSNLTMPNDLKQAVKIMTKYLYEKIRSNAIGLSRFKIADIEMEYFKDNIPIEIKLILDGYRRHRL